MATYSIGTSDPTITPDRGAGVWNSEPTTMEMLLKKQAIIQVLPPAYVLIGDDAVKHMLHYFGNRGTDFNIDLEGLITVDDEKKEFENELLRARKFTETLPIGTHNITSNTATNGYAHKSESANWFFATGGYSYWGKGVAKVSDAGGGQKAYELEFEYKFFDRYNWDGGKKVEIFGIEVTDEFMGRFHREGLAKEFNMYGSLKRIAKWTGLTTNNPTITKPGDRG
jgi:hypothetical protein